VPLVIAQSATQTSQAGAGTADVTGSSLSMASGWFSATKTLRYTLTGTKTGANAAMVVHLYLLDAQVMSLTASDAAAGDWTATFVVHEYTGTANQKITGTLQVNGKVSVVDYAAATKNMAAGATTIKAQIQSQNAGDTVTNEYVNIEHWVK
jgi:ABC-type enterobactin transport system permease subunit